MIIDPNLQDMIKFIYHKLKDLNSGGGSGGVTPTQLATALASKVDVVAGKGLSTNDYTNADKSKVSTIGDKLDKGGYTGTAQDLKNATDGKADSNHSHSWSNITGKPNDLATFSNLTVGTKNLVYNSRFKGNNYFSWYQENDATFGKVMRLDRPGGGGNFQETFNMSSVDLSNKDLIFMVIAKPLTTDSKFNFGKWQETYAVLNENSSKKSLGNDWYVYWSKINVPYIGNGTLGINTVSGSWLFYACGIFESKILVDWSPAPEDFLKVTGEEKVQLSNGTTLTYAELRAKMGL